MAERAGRYVLQGVVGVGSFATVHRARDHSLDDEVVVKVLAENHSLNPEIRERFIAEGRSLRRVTSPHVVRVHDMGETDRGQPFLVLEHADRGTLADRVRTLRARGWRARPADVLALARELAAAVGAVHRARLVHRDLSPGNILLATDPESSAPRDAGPALPDAGTRPGGPPAPGAGPGPGTPTDSGHDGGAGRVGGAGGDGGAGRVGGAGRETTDRVAGSDVIRPGERLVLADLGMCKDLAVHSGLTVAGGTAGFRPPEQDVTGVVDTRADLWAMSTLLAWLTEGADVPAPLAAVLDRGRAHDPEERHPDVATWLTDVEDALAPPAPAPAVAGVVDASDSPADGERRAAGAPGGSSDDGPGARGGRGRAAPGSRLLPVAAVVALLLVLGGLWFGQRLAAPPSSTGEASIAIDGPAEVTVGETAELVAVVEGIETWVWTLPTGAQQVGGAAVLTATSPGTGRVVLRARAPDGTDLEVVHHLRVTE